MKKLFFACAILLGSMGMYACGGNEGTTETEQNESVISEDTTVSEMEVERTVVETDTKNET